MRIFFHLNGFYVEGIHEIPAGAVEIDAALHDALLQGQSDGKTIMPPDADHSTPWLMEKAARLKRAAREAFFHRLDAKIKSERIISLRLQAQAAQTEEFTPEEYTTFATAGLFPVWTVGESYVKGNRIAHEGVAYEVQQPVTAQAHQPPGSQGMLAIYRPISADPDTGDEPDGSLENPYTFIYGMDVKEGSYYTHEGALYLAKADMPACIWQPGTPGLWQWELVEN